MGVGLVVATFLIALTQGMSILWDVTLPKSIVGISGSCIRVPCSFDVPDLLHQQLKDCSKWGEWTKRIKVIEQMVVVGDLRMKNCTTMVFNFTETDSDVYYFLLDCARDLKHSFFERGVNITVQPGPSPPRLTVVNEMLVGIKSELLCSVPVPCPSMPPTIDWTLPDSFKDWNKSQQIIQEEDGLWTMTSLVTFIPSVDHRNEKVTCSVSYPLSKGGSTKPSATSERLLVHYAPRFTNATLNTSAPIFVGYFVAFICSSDAIPPPAFYWFKVFGEKPIEVGVGKTLVLKIHQGDSGLYLCKATSRMGSEESKPVYLEVSVSTDTVSGSITFTGPYTICGVLVGLYILTVVVGVCRFRSLSRRLKQIEVKAEHTYTDIKINNITSDYEQLQPQTPQTPPPDENYVNVPNSP